MDVLSHHRCLWANPSLMQEIKVFVRDLTLAVATASSADS